MYGARSSHWPSKALKPPKPFGPTMSGALPPPSCVDSVLRAWSYVTASNLRVLPGAVLEKSAATLFSTGTWVGSWPVPRQQYQRRLAGGNENGVSVASGASLTAVVGAAPDGAELDVVDGLQAEAMKIAAP